MTEPKQKIRDLAPTAVRLAPELRHALAKEAAINGRSLHGEIVHRLQQSLNFQADAGGGYRVAEPPVVLHRTTTEPVLNSSEQWLISVFRSMPPEKQLALISLFK